MATKDIYAAKENLGQHHGSVTVYPGSPLAKGNVNIGYNISYGFDSNLLARPSVTGLIPASHLGSGHLSTVSISGEYELRFDDINYYTSSGLRN